LIQAMVRSTTAEIIDLDNYRRQRLIERLGLIRYCPPLYG